MTNEPDIAIVGAGAAGIGAARRLAGRGLSVVMLEALSRPGGRAWTHSADDMRIDLGCGWLHSADRNPWTRIAEEAGFTIDRRTPAWRTQYRDLGFPPAAQQEANAAFSQWFEDLAVSPPTSDRALDVVERGGRWTPYLQAMSGFISGDALERISARDLMTYDKASTGRNWRLPAGYGALITASLPSEIELHLATPVESIAILRERVELRTTAGTVRSRAVILTASTNVLASGMIALPSALDPWRDAAAKLPLGYDEKLYLEIVGSSPFEAETHVLGDPHDAMTGSYYIRPFGWPVIECYLGGEGARSVATEGHQTAFGRAIDQLASLFGSAIRPCLRPLVASNWTNTAMIGGAYSHALPGQAEARVKLAAPFGERLFFAGEATHVTDYSTAHGAYLSGKRAADEALALLRPQDLVDSPGMDLEASIVRGG